SRAIGERRSDRARKRGAHRAAVGATEKRGYRSRPPHVLRHGAEGASVDNQAADRRELLLELSVQNPWQPVLSGEVAANAGGRLEHLLASPFLAAQRLQNVVKALVAAGAPEAGRRETISRMAGDNVHDRELARKRLRAEDLQVAQSETDHEISRGENACFRRERPAVAGEDARRKRRRLVQDALGRESREDTDPETRQARPPRSAPCECAGDDNRSV